MKGYFKKIFVCLSAVILVLSLSGCDLLGGGGGNGGSQPPAVYISMSEVTLAEGNTVQLYASSTDGSEIIWETSNSAVATVDEGLVTAVSKGEAVIMASTEAVMATCSVTVTEAPSLPSTPSDGDNTDTETLTLSLTSWSLEVGTTVTITATSSVQGAEITWNSSNKTVATVSNGVVTALNAGTSTITASTGTVTAKCEITVKEATPAGSHKDGYNLVWYDEFNGTSLDTKKWGYQTGIRDVYHDYDTQNWGWGNEELQYYTEDAVSISNGSLVITAKKQSMDGKDYTSGRILTRDKASWTYGYFEARMKTPTGSGMWPAFWMLPQPSSYANINNKYGGWPYNGEIDIMEAKGSRYNQVDTTLHYGPVADGTWNSQYDTNITYLSTNTDQWHTYAVEWTSYYIKWFVDGEEAMCVTSDVWYSRSPLATSSSAPFDQPFYILLNLAVGGRYDNYAEPGSSFTSANMYVDYVRVYEKA